MSATIAKAAIASAAALFVLSAPAAAGGYYGSYWSGCNCSYAQPRVRVTYAVQPVVYYQRVLVERRAYMPLQAYPVDLGPSYEGPAIVSVNTGVSYTPTPYVPAARWTWGVRYGDGWRDPAWRYGWRGAGVRYGWRGAGVRYGWRGAGVRYGWRGAGWRHGAHVYRGGAYRHAAGYRAGRAYRHGGPRRAH